MTTDAPLPDAPSDNLAPEVGAALASFCELLDCMSIESATGLSSSAMQEISAHLKSIARLALDGDVRVLIYDKETFLELEGDNAEAMGALCESVEALHQSEAA